MENKIAKVYKKYSLRNRQRKVNKMYEEDGLTDEVFNEQLAINQERNKHDITDEEQVVYDGYVQ